MTPGRSGLAGSPRSCHGNRIIDPGGDAGYCIIVVFCETIMEAERINAIAKQLQDIDNRVAELRRYL